MITMGKRRSSRWDLDHLRIEPGIEMPGYCQSSLCDGQPPFAPFVHPKPPLVHSRGAGARPVSGARRSRRFNSRLTTRRNFPTPPPIRTLKRPEGRAPQRRQARHSCRTATQTKSQPRRGGILCPHPDDFAPERSLVLLGVTMSQRYQPGRLRIIRVYRCPAVVNHSKTRPNAPLVAVSL